MNDKNDCQSRQSTKSVKNRIFVGNEQNPFDAGYVPIHLKEKELIIRSRLPIYLNTLNSASKISWGSFFERGRWVSFRRLCSHLNLVIKTLGKVTKEPRNEGWTNFTDYQVGA